MLDAALPSDAEPRGGRGVRLDGLRLDGRAADGKSGLSGTTRGGFLSTLCKVNVLSEITKGSAR